MTLLQNTTGTTFLPYSPPISVSVSYSNQTFTSVPGLTPGTGLSFGVSQNGSGTTATASPIYALMNSVGGGTNNQFTSNPNGTSGTGIDVNVNYSASMFTAAGPLSTTVAGGRYYYGNMTVTFNRPVNDPVLHFVGLGGALGGGQGISTEFDLVTTGVSVTRLSGSTEFNVTTANGVTSIVNSATALNANCGAGGACGSVKVTGNGLTTVTFRVYLRGDGRGNWAQSGVFAGDRWTLGVSLRSPSTISGTVFDDANGGTIDGTATNAGGGLFANLVSGGLVIATTTVPASGTYAFSGLWEGTYSVVLSTTQGTIGSAPPTASLPTNWVTTGEGIGATPTTGDGTPNGIVSVVVPGTGTTNDVPNVNFGIEQLPAPTSATLASQVNPGGLNGVSIAPASFTGTDPDGTVTNIHYTAFPSNVTSLTIGSTLYTALTFPAGGVTVATGTVIRIDPNDGAVTAVIPFRVIDNAGQESTTTGSVSVPFTGLNVAGTVFNDANGLTDNIINGTGTNAGGGLYALLVDATSNVVASQLLPTTGAYSFANISAGVYSVRLSTSAGTVGNASPAVSLPTGWTFTGEGTAPAGDGTPNGSTQVTLITTSVSGVNFGLDQLPVPTSLTISGQPNSGGNFSVSVPPTSFTGTDADGTITSIRYTAFPTNVTSLTIGTTAYTSANFPAGGVTATAGTSVRIAPVDGNITVNIPFRVIDNAGQEGTTTGTVGVPFLTVTDFCNSQVLFFNEDFGAGTGFGPPLATGVTNYTYTGTNPTNDGFYSLLNNPDQSDDYGNINNVWLHGPDHTGNLNGRMLVINGANPGQVAYSVPVSGLVVGRFYSLRTYISNILNTTVITGQNIKPNIILRVLDNANNVLASVSTGDIATTSTLTWLPQSMSFTASTSSVKFELISNAAAGNGNDFALDDIQFFEVIQPVLSTTAVTSSCPATSVSLAGVTASNQPTSTTLTWHSSATATAGNRISNITTLTSGTYYAAFYDGSCFTKTSPFVVLIVPCANPDAGIAITVGTSGTVVGNVAANDLVNGQAATLGTGGNATVAQVGTYPTGVTLNATTGSLSVAAGTAPGSYTVTYQLCDKLSPVNCTTAIATFTVSTSVTAAPDAGTVSAGTGGTAVTNVAANDVINGQSATLGTGGNATVAQVGTYPTGITLNAATGSLSVAQGTAPGSYTVTYQLCDKLTIPTCTTTTALITVTPSVLATPDAGTVSAGTGGTAVANVTTNDIVNGQPATLGTGGNATVAQVGTYPTGITLNPTTGSLSIAQGTAPGAYTVAYQLCDKLTPATCSTAIVSFTVTPSLTANPDPGLTISAASSGTVVGNVAANDLVNGQAATLGTGGNATVAQVGTYPTGVTLNPTTGSLSVAAGTAPGSYTVTYQLCDKLSPVNCTTAIATFVVTPTLSGTVFDDGNGLTDNLINGTGTNAGGLYAILTNAAATSVLANALVSSSGAYSFTGLSAGTYSVQLSTTSAVVGTTPPTASIPAGYTFTGEGTAASGDGTPNGITSVVLTATTSLTNVNFGLDQLPVPTSTTLASQINPGGLTTVTIPPASFTGTDPDGTITTIRYTAFPSNASSITIGATTYILGGLLFPAAGVTVASGTTVRIDPIDGNVTVAIPFRVIDNAGVESATTGTLFVPFTGLTVSGTILNDANGLTDGQINGTGTNAGGLFANLVNASGNVVAFQSVPASGIYSFTGVTASTYSVQLSTTTAVIGSVAPAVSLPTGYTFTGEGTATAGDGTPNGITSVTVTTASVSGVNFGIDQLPTPTSATLTAQANPGGINGVSIPPASFTGTDPDGTVASIRYTTFPTNVNSLTIGNAVYTSANFPAGGLTTTTGTSVRIDPVDGNVTVVVPFRVIDNAGQEGTATGSVNIPLTSLSVSGTVFNDANGLTDNIINGTGTNAGGGLYANLVDATGNVAAAQLVPVSGVYSFSNVSVGVYSVQLSTTTTAVGSVAPMVSLPTGWTFTGEGTAPAGDGTPNGSTQVTLTTASISGVNFGLDQLPISTATTLTAQANPGGTNGISIPPASFTGTDADGTITAIRYTSFPTNVASLTIGTTAYTSASFPAGGVTAVTGTVVRIDPNDGAVTAVVPFRVIDNAGVESAATANVSVPFTYVVTATPDAGTVSAGTGGTAVTNVAANDVINGQSATLGTGGNATVAQVGTYPTGITLNTTTGSLSVAQGTAPGSYTVTYQLCDKLTIPTCTTTTALITVTPSVLAAPDAGTVSAGTGGTAVTNVAANDIVNGQSATLGTGGNATVALINPPAGVTLDPTTGSLSVAAGTAPGSYTVTYQLCDKLTPATCTTGVVSYTVTPGIRGTIFDDANGLTDNLINGTGTNAGGLFAVLTNATNTVVASVSVAPGGTYRFDNVAPATYTVRLSTTAATVGSAPPVVSLPANWTFTGEGTAAAGDGLVNGSTSVIVGSSEVSGVNFGLDQLPTPTSTTLLARANPGGTNAITIPPSSLTGTDPDGTVASIRYVSFPTNTTTLYIGNTAYTSATFPAGGITAASNLPVHLDPTDGTNGVVTSVISFRVVDNAGVESTTTATATIPFTCVATFCPPVTGKKISSR
jgi:hypothetical protein